MTLFHGPFRHSFPLSLSSYWFERTNGIKSSFVDPVADCRGPLLGDGAEASSAAAASAAARRSAGVQRLLAHHQRSRRFRGLGPASTAGDRTDVDSIGDYATDDQAGLENASIMNDAGLTDAEGLFRLGHISRKKMSNGTQTSNCNLNQAGADQEFQSMIKVMQFDCGNGTNRLAIKKRIKQQKDESMCSFHEILDFGYPRCAERRQLAAERRGSCSGRL